MKIFGKNKQNTSRGKPNGEVKIIDDSTVKSTGAHQLYDCEFDIDKMEYAYLVINSSLESCLFVMTGNPPQQNHISTEYKGFQKVYNRLSEKYGFDDELFEKYVDTKGQLKVCIWRKKYEPSYAILIESYSDVTDGFEVQSPQKEFISWDLPLEELRTKKEVQIESNTYRGKTLYFEYPVRIGSVILKNFKAIIHKNREDVPVLHFYTKCYDVSNTDQSYRELKNHFINDVGLQPGCGWDRDDQKKTPFDLQGMSLSLSYTYDSEYGFEAGYTSFTIENNRDYSTVLVDEDYEHDIAVSQFQRLNEHIYIAGDYKKEEQIQRRPPKLSEVCGDRPVVWRDDENHKIGFASGRFARVFDARKIEEITIQNTLPAKGAGRADLEVILQGKKQHAVFSGSCHDFDADAEKMEEVTGKPVEFLPEMMDV